MKLLALAIGVFIAIVGLIAVLAPDTLLTIIRGLLTPGGLYAIALFRIVVGVILLRAAPGSRAPGILGVVGGLIVISGLITPLIGLERARAMFEWWAAQPGLVMRVWGALVVLVGGLVAYGVSGSWRRA